MKAKAAISLVICSWSGCALADAAPSSKERHEIRVLVQKYAKCIVQRHHNEAKVALLSDVDNDDIVAHHGSIVDENCMAPGTSVRFPADMYRYALAEALIKADFLITGPASFEDRLPLAHLAMPSRPDLDKGMAAAKSSSTRKKMRDDYDKKLATAALSQYGECVSRYDPAGSRLWILTPPDGPEELSRIKAMMPAFSQCLESGEKIAFGREMLRGAVALNYYRLANATPQPATAIEQ